MNENDFEEYQRGKEPSVDAAGLCFAACALLAAAAIIADLIQRVL